MNRKSTIHYIKSLDGIRALAMLGVMFFHLLPTKVEGGYLGVVTFFVLAGFLSTRTVIFSEHKRNFTRSLRSFVQKIRKLLPELIAMIFITILIMFFTLSEYLPDVRSQAISSVFCINNIVQMINGESYFEAMATLKPFTHIWALSMEFQFYLLFALSISALYRSEKKKKWLYLLCGVTIFSLLVINLTYQQNADNTKVYYNTLARLSSFSIGGIGAFFFATKEQSIKNGSYPTSIAILVTIGISIYSFLFGGISEFIYRYGFLLYSLLSLGTIYLVSTKNTPISEFLGSDIFRAIARRSYSIYIWHFPVFKLYEKLMWRSQVPSFLSLLMEFSLALLVAELAYTVFRKLQKEKRTRQTKHRVALLATAILIILPYKPHGVGVEKYRMLSELRMGIGGADIEIGRSKNEDKDYLEQRAGQIMDIPTSDQERESSESTTTDTSPSTEASSTTTVPKSSEEPEPSSVTTTSTSNTEVSSQEDTRNEETTEPSTETTADTANEASDSTEDETITNDVLSSTTSSTEAGDKKTEETTATVTTEPTRETTDNSYEPELFVPAVPIDKIKQTTEQETSDSTKYSDELLEFKKIYDEYSAMFPNIPISFDEYLTIRDRKITLVGDSISAMIATRLVEFFPNIEISAKKNRQSYEANDCYLAMKKEGRIGDVVILALGVNGSVDQANFDLVRDDIGVGKPMIITSIIHYNPTIEQDLNAAVYDYANTRENIYTIQWHENCKSHPELLYDDGVHPTDEGSIAYSYLIMDAVYRALQGQTISEY